MNEFFESLGRRWQKAAERRGVKIEPPKLDPKVAEELLDLARVVSHARERRFAPLATYTAGVAVERLREAKPEDADGIAAFIREVRDELEREAPADGAAGGTGERGVREPRVPRGPAARSERSERRARWGGCGERAPPNRGQDPPP